MNRMFSYGIPKISSEGELIYQNQQRDLLPCCVFKLFWASLRLEHNLLIILCLDGDIIVSQW